MSQTNRPRRGHWILLAGAVICGGAIRLYDLGGKSLWYDEALSAWFSGLPLGKLWGEAPGYETHPPLYYTMLKAWTGLFGAGEPALRGLSALAGTAAIPVVYSLGRICAGEKIGRMAGIFSAVIFALAPIHIVYSQEARPYAFLVLWAALAMLGAMALAVQPALAARPFFGLGAVEGKRDSYPFWAWTALIMGTAMALWFHNLGFTLAAALLAAAGTGLLWKNNFSRAYVLNALLAVGIVALIYGPFIPWFIKQSANVGGAFWLKSINLSLIGRRLDEIFFLYMPGLWPKALLTGLAGWGFITVKRERGSLPALILAGVMVIPLALIISISYLFTPVFVARTMIWTSAPFYTAAGIGLAALAAERNRIVWIPLGLLTLAALLTGVMTHFRGAKEPWREMTRLMAEKAKPGDMALVLPNSAVIPFSYYAARYMPDMKILPLPAPFPAVGMDRPYPTGNMAEPGFAEADEILLDGITCDKGSVWLVARFMTMFDPAKRVMAVLEKRCGLVESGGNMSLMIYHFAGKKRAP